MPAYYGILPSPLKLTLWLQSLTGASWAPLPMGDVGVEGSLLCFRSWGSSISARWDQGIALCIERTGPAQDPLPSSLEMWAAERALRVPLRTWRLEW